jgi:branched-chain amino acid transport system substrate-binding protein
MGTDFRWSRVIALLTSLGMLAAACGGGSDSASSDSGSDGGGDTAAEGEAEDAGSDAGSIDTDEAEDAVAEAASSEAGSDAAGSTATNIEELEAEWAATRQTQIDMLTAGMESGEYGIGDDNILRGPGGFEIDLNNCPSDWVDTEGIAETIKVGHPGPQSGNLAAYGNMGIGWETYFDYVNETGGIGGLPLELIRKDDQYVATVTIELVDELLQSEKPFAFHTLGSPSTLAVYDTLNQQCVPQMLVATGHPAWGDPVVHPWTTGSQLGYLTESILWGAWIKENMADQLPVKVAGLVMDNDFGLAYEQGMERYAEENPDVISEFISVRFDPAAPTVTNEMTTIAAAQPDVALGMMAGNPCLLMVEEAGRNGLKDSGAVLFISSTCKDPNSFMIPAGEAADGWRIVGGGQKVNTDPQYADDAYVQFANGLLTDAELDINIGLYFTGFFYAWPFVESFRVANELPGGLTRTNVMLAIRSLDVNHPQLIEGVTFAMNGNEDSYFVEGSDFSVYDAEAETWIQEGGIVDLNGSSPNCTWTDTGCA